MGFEKYQVVFLDNIKKDIKRFVYFAKEVYKDNLNWVAPIFRDQITFIHKGPFHEIGEIQLIMVYNSNNEPVARISVHINHKHDQHYNTHQGFFGFFEALNNQEAVDLLFQEGIKWLKSKGCVSILGPLNFAIYDDCVGLLINNFNEDPILLCAYNPKYYINLLKNIGFKKEIDWYAVWKDTTIPPLLERIYHRVDKKSHIVIRNPNMKKWTEETNLVRHIFEDAWIENWGNVPFTDKQWQHIVKEIKLIMKPKLSFILEYENKPIGFIISVPNAFEALKHAKGHLFPFGLFKILFNLRKIKKLRTIIMGILKPFRNKGYEMALIYKTIVAGKKLGYVGSDCSLIVETNKALLRGLEMIQIKKYKTFRLYHYQF